MPSLAVSSYHQLEMLGIGDEAAFEQQVVERMKASAGLPKDARVSRLRLRSLLQQQIDDAPKLLGYIEGGHEDALRLSATRRASSARSCW